MTAYSQLKAAHHPERIDAFRRGTLPVPVHVQMILSDLCNQDCSFCAYRMSAGLSTELFATAETHNPNRKMPTDKAVEILNDCAQLGVRAVQFTGGGEPTVHKDHLRIFDHAQALGLDTALVTNGVKLDAGHRAVQAMKWIRISVDAGKPQTYARIRRVSTGHWNKVWSCVHNLSRDYGGRLGVGFVVTPENYSEIADCANHARDFGAQNIRIGAVFSKDGIGFYGSLIPRIIDEIERAKHEEIDGFKVIDLFGRRLGDLEAASPQHSACYYQHMTTYIGADLNVYRCCNTSYSELGTVANLRDKRFRDHVMEQQPLDSFDARQCRFCQFTGHNAALRGLVEAPEDANFV